MAPHSKHPAHCHALPGPQPLCALRARRPSPPRRAPGCGCCCSGARQEAAQARRWLRRPTMHRALGPALPLEPSCRASRRRAREPARAGPPRKGPGAYAEAVVGTLGGGAGSRRGGGGRGIRSGAGPRAAGGRWVGPGAGRAGAAEGRGRGLRGRYRGEGGARPLALLPAAVAAAGDRGTWRCSEVGALRDLPFREWEVFSSSC